MKEIRGRNLFFSPDVEGAVRHRPTDADVVERRRERAQGRHRAADLRGGLGIVQRQLVVKHLIDIAIRMLKQQPGLQNLQRSWHGIA